MYAVLGWIYIVKASDRVGISTPYQGLSAPCLESLFRVTQLTQHEDDQLVQQHQRWFKEMKLDNYEESNPRKCGQIV